MRPSRPLIALSLGASLVVGSFSAHAATKAKPVCNLLVDPAGDADGHDVGPNLATGPVKASTFPNEHGGPSADGLDILSADVAGDKHNVTGVIRVKKLALTNPQFPTGMSWTLSFSIDEVSISLVAHTNPIGTPHFDGAYAGTTGGTLFNGGVTGFFDLAKSEVHITIDSQTLSGQTDAKPGAKITQISATTSPDIAAPDPTGKVSSSGAIFEDAVWNQDSATSSKTYVIGAPSCVTPGK